MEQNFKTSQLEHYSELESQLAVKNYKWTEWQKISREPIKIIYQSSGRAVE